MMGTIYTFKGLTWMSMSTQKIGLRDIPRWLKGHVTRLIADRVHRTQYKLAKATGEKQTCERRFDDFRGRTPEQYQVAKSTYERHAQKPDTWLKQEGYRKCSYCGGMKPEDAIVLLKENDDAELVTTDKNYKLYLHYTRNGLAQTSKLYRQHFTPDITWMQMIDLAKRSGKLNKWALHLREQPKPATQDPWLP